MLLLPHNTQIFNINTGNISATISVNNNTIESFSCNNPTYFLWYWMNSYADLIRTQLPQYGFDVTCSLDELPDIFGELTDNRGEKSFFCLKYNNQTMPYNKQFCNGGGLVSVSSGQPDQYFPGITECKMPMLVHKTSLNTILTQYCNKYHSNDTACNFQILSYNIDDSKQRRDFLTQHINCSNNKPQYDKIWVFKEDQESAEGIHFENNHELIYKLIAPNKTEENEYYKHCSHIKPFTKNRQIRKNGFKFSKTETGDEFRVSHQGLVMQQYVANPLLIEDRIFHIRSMMLIPSYSNPFVVLHYKQGMIARNINPYDRTSLRKSVLTSNVHTSYYLNTEYKARNGFYFKQIWGYSRFQTYLNDVFGENTTDYTQNKLQNDIKNIIKHVFNANEYYNNYNGTERGYSKLFNNKHDFSFGMYCLDIIINDQFELKLLEVNEHCGFHCPGYRTDADILDNNGEEWICKSFAKESTDILLEIFEQKLNNNTIKSIKSLNQFEIAFWKND